MVGARIRQARVSRKLSLNEVASRARVSMATLSRIERDKQGLDLGLFLTLCKVLQSSPQEMLDGEAAENDDSVATRIASMQHEDRLQLWHELAEGCRSVRRSRARLQIRKLADEVEELIAQLEFVRSAVESVHSRVRRR